MSREYEYSNAIERKMHGHLKSLGFNLTKPPKTMTIIRKTVLLNYLRTIRTACEILEQAIEQYCEYKTTPGKCEKE